MNDQRASLRVCVVLAVFGALSFMAMLGRPSLSSIRPVDMIHLIGTGMCFGSAIVAFVWHRHGRGSP
jgi:uncharacterized membrane protein YcaP (DUF421 family)